MFIFLIVKFSLFKSFISHLCPMALLSFFDELLAYTQSIEILEFLGLVFGVLCVLFLIKENILTWVCGIIYVLISFVIFWKARLYGDFLLHIFFLFLNIYGWREWTKGNRETADSKFPITRLNIRGNVIYLFLSVIGIMLFAEFLKIIPTWIENMESAALPFWDSTTSVLSITGMWLTAKKRIDNWYYWLVVDLLATGIYYYKELYFYSLLYFIYIGLAIVGYRAWRKSMNSQSVHV